MLELLGRLPEDPIIAALDVAHGDRAVVVALLLEAQPKPDESWSVRTKQIVAQHPPRRHKWQ